MWPDAQDALDVVMWILILLLGGGGGALVVQLWRQRQRNKESNAMLAQNKEMGEVELTEKIQKIVDSQMENMTRRVEKVEVENANLRRLLQASLNFIQQLLSHIWILRTRFVEPQVHVPEVPKIPNALLEYVVPYEDEPPEKQ